jgi:hypothetical protein
MLKLESLLRSVDLARMAELVQGAALDCRFREDENDLRAVAQLLIDLQGALGERPAD